MSNWHVEVIGYLSAYTRIEQGPVIADGISIWELPDNQMALHLVDIKPFASGVTTIEHFVELSESYRLNNSRLIHLWEDIWFQHPDMVKARLLAMLGISQRIHARKTTVNRITKPVMDRFFNQNHLNNGVQARYKYGLFINDELLAAASFSGGRPVEREGETFRSFELIRFANKSNTTVVGGLSKLIKRFVDEVQPDDLMTYADRDWSAGQGYEKLGFNLEGITDPQAFWIHPLTMVRYFPHRLPAQLLHDFEQQTQYADIEPFLVASGYLRIFNTGNLKYLKKFK